MLNCHQQARFDVQKRGFEVLLKEDGLKTNSTAAWALLRDRERSGSPSLLFVATHFKAGYNPEAAEKRRQQAASLVKIVNGLKSANPDCGSVILCGDFNGEPGEKFYDLISSGIDGGIASAYKVANGGREPEYTTYKKRAGSDHRWCIDYIWFSEGTLRLAEVLKLPTPQEIGHNIMLPSLRFPSDHLSLVATFEHVT